jgi:nucleoside-diphosphate-sugar epimerase
MMMSCIRSFYDGKKMPFTKGGQVWDYLNCDDAGEAFFLVAEKGSDGAVYPLGSGECRELAAYITAVRDIVRPGSPIGLGELEYTPNQVMYLCADISRLTADTGFVPKIRFEDGIKATVDWIKEQDDFKKSLL